nr:uncharacterized protein LOC117688235 isoform X2 [Crassostrea gigas]
MGSQTSVVWKEELIQMLHYRVYQNHWSQILRQQLAVHRKLIVHFLQLQALRLWKSALIHYKINRQNLQKELKRKRVHQERESLKNWKKST